MFASTSTAFASDNTDNGTEDNKNDDLLDLLGEIDAEIEGEFSDEFTLKSDIQVQIAHEITVRGASSGNEKLVQRSIDFIVGDDYASAAFRFCVKHELYHHQHVRATALKIKEEIEKMPEDARPAVGGAAAKRRRREGVPEKRKKTAQERYEVMRE
jgi:hypothetical protein